MNINANDTIAGVPILRVRDLIRRTNLEELYFGHAARFLDLDHTETQALLDELVRDGRLEPARKGMADEHWGAAYPITTAGYALGNASAARPVKRATAQRVLDGFLDRVEQANADDRYVRRVVEVILFGSFATKEKETVSDVDLAIGLERKRELTREEASTLAGHYAGHPVRETDVRGEVALYKFLKGGSRVLSLVPLDEGHREIATAGPHRQVWPTA